MAAFLLGSPAFGWSAAGHMVVAQIAYDRLDPSARQEVDRLVDLLSDFEPSHGDAVTASLWMDQVRASGWRAFDHWHYINLPYNAGGLEKLPTVDTDNAVNAVRQAVRTLGNPEAPDLAKAIMLRVLLHVAGDLHQPLHASGRVTAAHPKGDRGGNDFLLPGLDGEPSNLHRLWDGTVGLLPQLEGTADELASVKSMTAELLAAVPEDMLTEWQDLNPDTWAREGFHLATSVVYVGISEGRAPSEVYRVKGQLVARRRLVLGGFRLGALLNSLLSPGGEQP